MQSLESHILEKTHPQLKEVLLQVNYPYVFKGRPFVLELAYSDRYCGADYWLYLKTSTFGKCPYNVLWTNRKTFLRCFPSEDIGKKGNKKDFSLLFELSDTDLELRKSFLENVIHQTNALKAFPRGLAVSYALNYHLIKQFNQELHQPLLESIRERNRFLNEIQKALGFGSIMEGLGTDSYTRQLWFNKNHLEELPATEARKALRYCVYKIEWLAKCFSQCLALDKERHQAGENFCKELENIGDINLESVISLLHLIMDGKYDYNAKTYFSVARRIKEPLTFDFESDEKIKEELKQVRVPADFSTATFTIQDKNYTLEELLQPHFNDFIQKRGEIDQQLIQTLEKNRLQLGKDYQLKDRLKNEAHFFFKLLYSKQEFSEVKDILGYRIIVPEKESCFQIYNLLKQTYTPLSNSVQDFITKPKSNGYSSLDFYVSIAEIPVQIQIRTSQMEFIDEVGSANHDRMKEEQVEKYQIMLKDNSGEVINHFRSCVNNLIQSYERAKKRN